jgi:hypothetical protein
MKLISQGAKMKVLATILQGNPNQVTALKKTGLKSVADMKGRSVAMPNGGSQVAMFPLVLAANGLKETDIKLVNMPPDSMVPSLLQGTVDVILGSVDAYGPQLKSMNVETDEFPVHRFRRTDGLDLDHRIGRVPGGPSGPGQGVRGCQPEGLVRGARRSAGRHRRHEEDVSGCEREARPGPDRRHQGSDVRQSRQIRRQGDAGAMDRHGQDPVGNRRAAEDIPATKAYYTYDYLPPESALRSCPLK